LDFQATLERVRFKLGDEELVTSASEEKLAEARRLLDMLKARLGEGEPAKLEQSLATFQGRLFADFDRKIVALRENLRVGPMTVANLPKQLTDRFIGQGGMYLLKVFPHGNSWGREGVQQFVREIRSIDPDAIGDPILAWEHGRSMEKGYLLGGLYAAIAMVVVIVWSFGSVAHLLLSLVPLVVGAAWTLGLMQLFGINFNLANLIILPLIVGYGIINGLQIVKRYQQEAGKGPVMANSTGRAVFLSTATSMVGFGSLMVASHRGIFSLGFLLAVGVGSVLLASLTVLPALLWVLSGARRSEQMSEMLQPAVYSKGSLPLSKPGREEDRPLGRRGLP
jgi:hypothetical protein